jgi:hypothetical protein
MKQKLIHQHKRLAMGDTIKGYALGGTIASELPAVRVRPSGTAVNPLRAAKSNNGIPRLKSGGRP